MLGDTSIPSGVPPPPEEVRELSGVRYRASRWDGRRLASLAGALAAAADHLIRLSDADLLAAWESTVEAFLDPASPARRRLDDPLSTLCRLSPPSLAAGLEAVLGGLRGEPARRLVAEAAERRRGSGLVLVVLASNLPALAAQALLPTLALRRPVLLKSPSAEPLFAPALLEELRRREPRLGEASAAVTWPGGSRDLEAGVLTRAARIVAYGEAESLRDLERRAPGRVLPYGPKLSIGIVARGAHGAAADRGLARDVALFDQRGCLSIHAVYTDGDPERLAEGLARQLARLARRWPPWPPTAAEAAAVRLARETAELRGLRMPRLSPRAGTVILEDRHELEPSPGRRTVRIHRVERLEMVPRLLTAWRGHLQGAALAGKAAWALRPALEALGLSRFAPPGRLQTPDALWHNGGVNPLRALES